MGSSIKVLSTTMSEISSILDQALDPELDRQDLIDKLQVAQKRIQSLQKVLNRDTEILDKIKHNIEPLGDTIKGYRQARTVYDASFFEALSPILQRELGKFLSSFFTGPRRYPYWTIKAQGQGGV